MATPTITIRPWTEGICDTCCSPATFRHRIILPPWEWFTLRCKNHTGNSSRVPDICYTEEGRCVRCYIPNLTDLCYICQRELSGNSVNIPDRDAFFFAVEQMFTREKLSSSQHSRNRRSMDDDYAD